MTLKWSKEEELKLNDLLNLNDNSLRRHKVGKLIRDNFRLRDWLKAQARGKPGFKVKDES